MSYVFGLDLVVLLALLGTFLWLAIRSVLRVPLRRTAIEAVFVGYLLALIVVVLAPFGRVGAGEGEYVAASVNLVPFATIVGLARQFPGQVVRQLVGNAVLFVPLGVLLPALFARFRMLRSMTAMALTMSLGIEIAQFVMRLMSLTRRSLDVDDVILNVAGALLGFSLWWIATRLLVGGESVMDGDIESA